MGQEKYRLSFAGETLLQRICRIVQPEVSRILIVAAVDQEIPQSESDIEVLRDEIPDAGPLTGLSQTLAYLQTTDDPPVAATAARLIASGQRRVAALPDNLRT